MHNIQQLGTYNVPIKINRLLLMQSRSNGYKDVAHRTYTTHCDQGTNNKIVDLMHRAKSNITEADVAIEIPGIVGLNSVPNKIASIVNGWGTERLQFMLEVESNVGSVTVINYIQGYSEYNDITNSGIVNPNLRFYINSILVVNRLIDVTTNRIIVRPAAFFNLIKDYEPASSIVNPYDGVLNGNYDFNSMERQVLIRPYDICSNIHINNTYGTETRTVNITDAFNQDRAAVSKRANANPIKYFANTIGSYMGAKYNTTMGYDTTDVLRAATGFANEGQANDNVFIRALANVTGNLTPTTFSLTELSMLDPNLQHKTNYIKNNQMVVTQQYNSVLDTDVTAETYQPTIHNQKAHALAVVIPSLMVENFITEITLAITNVGGSPIITPMDFQSFVDNIDITSFVNRLISNIERQVIPTLTDYNNTVVEVLLTSNILTDTTISININGTGIMVYRFPTFCDGLYSPIISNAQQSKLIQNDIENILDLDQTVSQYNSMDLNV